MQLKRLNTFILPLECTQEEQTIIDDATRSVEGQQLAAKCLQNQCATAIWLPCVNKCAGKIYTTKVSLKCYMCQLETGVCAAKKCKACRARGADVTQSMAMECASCSSNSCKEVFKKCGLWRESMWRL